MKRAGTWTAIAVAIATAAGAWSAARAEPAAARFESGRITVEVRGRGPDVVLIPGLASSPAVWARTADALDDTHRVHLVQVSGFAGRAAGLNAEGPVFGPVKAELARYIRSAGLKRPALVGHSMGGALAMALAAEQPDLIRRVMAVDALPFFPLLMGASNTPKSVRPQAEAIRAALRAMTPEQYAAGAPAGVARLVKTPAARERSAGESAASDKAVVGQAMHDLMTTDLRPALKTARVPITVLYASDPATGPAAAVEALWTGAYGGAPGVKLVRIPDSLHFIMDDQPERFAREVEAFLAEP